MTESVPGVIARGKGAPVEVATILVPGPGPGPGPGEALVRVQPCGVCHTDLHYREGGIGDDFPYFLGHEAAGVVPPVEKFVSETISLVDVEKAFGKMERGEVLRSVVVF